MPNDSVDPHTDLAIGLVLDYVGQHPRAADTFEGIARWWLDDRWADVPADALRDALHHLVAEGVLRRRRLPSGRTLWYATPGARVACGEDD